MSQPPITTTTHVQGLAEIKRRMAAVQADIEDKAVKAGLRAAGKVAKNAIVAATPYDGKTPDGVHIKENVQVSRSRKRSVPGREVFTVAIKYGKHKDKQGKTRMNEGVAWYWKLLEFGTARIRKQSFIRPAFEAAKDDAIKAFTKAMERFVKRAEKKYGTKP